MWITKYPGWTAILSGLLVLIGSVVFYSECERFYLEPECVGGPMADGVRNIIFILAGIGAFYGLYVRTEGLKHEKKTKAEESISRAVEQMESESISVRCVGVRLLQRIAEENLSSEKIITDILMDFVESNHKFNVFDDGAQEESGPEHDERDYEEMRMARNCIDVEVALYALGEIISDKRREKEEIKFEHLNFSAFVLDGVNFSKFKFYDVHLNGASFSGANLSKAKFVRCDMRLAIFTNANSSGTDFNATEDS